MGRGIIFFWGGGLACGTTRDSVPDVCLWVKVGFGSGMVWTLKTHPFSVGWSVKCETFARGWARCIHSIRGSLANHPIPDGFKRELPLFRCKFRFSSHRLDPIYYDSLGWMWVDVDKPLTLTHHDGDLEEKFSGGGSPIRKCFFFSVKGSHKSIVFILALKPKVKADALFQIFGWKEFFWGKLRLSIRFRVQGALFIVSIRSGWSVGSKVRLMVGSTIG